MNLFEKYEKLKNSNELIPIGSVWMCIRPESFFKGWIVKIIDKPKNSKDILIQKWNSSGMFIGSGRIINTNQFRKYWRELK